MEAQCSEWVTPIGITPIIPLSDRILGMRRHGHTARDSLHSVPEESSVVESAGQALAEVGDPTMVASRHAASLNLQSLRMTDQSDNLRARVCEQRGVEVRRPPLRGHSDNGLAGRSWMDVSLRIPSEFRNAAAAY